MIDFPEDLAAVQKLVTDDVQEDIHLDYKHGLACAKAKAAEISKDVSAFSNSDGGFLIYGVEEKDQHPVGIAGVANVEMTRERLEQIVNSNISPKIDGVIIRPIPNGPDETIFVVRIPQSFRAPHQARDKKYYKRYNFESVPMEDYEIQDVRGRQRRLLPLVNVDLSAPTGDVIYLTVEQVGLVPAYDVEFAFSRDPHWVEKKQTPPVFDRGIKFFPPRRRLQFYFGRLRSYVDPNHPVPTDFTVTVTYLHPDTGERVTDEFHFDIMDYYGSRIIPSDVATLTGTMREGFKQLADAAKKVESRLSPLMNLTSETGLRLSTPTMEYVRRLVGGEPLDRLQPAACSEGFLMDALGIDWNLAYELERQFQGHEPDRKLEDVPGVTPELLEKIASIVDHPNASECEPQTEPADEAVETGG